MAIRILRSQTTATPLTLLEGQLAYSENSSNLFIGGSGATVVKIGGNADVLKLAGIEDAAQVNLVDSVAGKTGDVTLVAGDITDWATEFVTSLNANSIDELSDVDTTTALPSTGQFLKWDGTNWVPAAVPGGVSTFIELDDTPVDYSGASLYWLRVNSAGDAVEFTPDVDDGTF